MAGLTRVGLDWFRALLAAREADDGGPAVCAYISMGSEPPTGPLLAALHAAGCAVYVPVCEPGFQLGWVRWFPGVDMARSRFAPVLEPVGERFPYTQLGQVLAVLVPALAVDGSGTRMGQGGGYYDRFLAGVGTPPAGPTALVPVAAVVHVNEVFAAGMLPRDPLDIPVEFALTPGGMQRLGTPAAP
ncbi:hypothetical protein ART_2026 [Arthrobacter sp. PAMC 25486]|nr:hypothetical protein ART_2026 [Arthrobacter sp. PAMC 25486]